jgi:hypothetical protein
MTPETGIRESDHGRPLMIGHKEAYQEVPPINEAACPRAEGSIWPRPLREEAFFGMVGELVRPIADQSEADIAAILIHVLVFFGNVIGNGPYFPVGGARHRANLFAVAVGRSSNSRKGTAAADVLQMGVALMLDKSS